MISFVAGGGAREIGASFYVLQLGTKYAAIDCGLRPGVSDNDPERLPNFDLEEVPRIDYAFISHAHLDHVGAVPCLVKRHPGITLIMTAATFELAQIQWEDTLNISAKEKITAPFSRNDVELAKKRVTIISADGRPWTFDKTFSVRAIPAGHILGAVSFVFTYRGKKIFATGDISFKNQETIDGAHVNEKAHVLITETTHAGKEIAELTAERARLVADVRRVIARKGSALITAPAYGRANEVFEILCEAGILEEDPPVFIDGMAMGVAEIYRKHLPERIYRHINTHYVNDSELREKIINKGPCIVIAASAMLYGGTAVGYAKSWLKREENAIFFTSYLEPCSPGKRVVESWEKGTSRIERGGELSSYPRRCEVGHYHLSAHADYNELKRLREILEPEQTLLVHGAPAGMATMIKECSSSALIYAPENNERVSLD